MVDNLITFPILDILALNLEACFLFTLISHSIPGAGKLASTLTRPGKVSIYFFNLEASTNNNSLLVVDVTKKIPLKSNSIGAVVSAGTFTHGHVGPQALDELLRITKPNGLFVISIKKELFISEGFKDKFINIKKKITLPTFNLFSIFGKNNDKKHGNDKAYVAIFRKKN